MRELYCQEHNKERSSRGCRSNLKLDRSTPRSLPLESVYAFLSMSSEKKVLSGRRVGLGVLIVPSDLTRRVKRLYRRWNRSMRAFEANLVSEGLSRDNGPNEKNRTYRQNWIVYLCWASSHICPFAYMWHSIKQPKSNAAMRTWV